MISLQGNITENLGSYTKLLRECRDGADLYIEPTSDNGPYPYQWKIGSADLRRFLGYVVFHGPEINGSDAEKKDHLCSLLRDVITKVDDKN